MRPSRTIARLSLVAAATATTLPLLGSAASAEQCIPSFTGSGPTVSVDVDYENPTRSSVGYDSSNVAVYFDLCLD